MHVVHHTPPCVHSVHVCTVIASCAAPFKAIKAGQKEISGRTHIIMITASVGDQATAAKQWDIVESYHDFPVSRPTSANTLVIAEDNRPHSEKVPTCHGESRNPSI